MEGLPRSGVGFGKCVRVPIVFVGRVIMSGKVGVKAVGGRRGLFGGGQRLMPV